MADKLGEVFVEILGDADPFAEEFADSIAEAGALAEAELSDALGDITDDLAADFAEGGEEAGGALADSMLDSVEGLPEEFGGVGEEAGGALAGSVTEGAGDLPGSLAGLGDEAAAALEDAISGVDIDLDVGDAGGAFDGLVADAQDAAGGIAESFEGVGEDIGEQLEEEVGGALDGLTDRLGSVQGAIGTVVGGAGLEGFARSQADVNAALGRMSIRLGENESDLRSMIGGMVDWTFGADDAVLSMEALAQRGVDNIDTLDRLLPRFDSFADATGKDMPDGIEEVTRVLGAFNIPAEQADEHLDTMTFLVNDLGVPLDRLGRQFGRNADDLADMNIGVDESAAFLAALRDRGMDGRDAMRAFTGAIGDSEGDLDALMRELGLTSDEMDHYRDMVGGAVGGMDDLADVNNEVMTPMERLTATAGNLMFRFGGLASAAGQVAAPIGAIGPTMLALNQTQQLLSAGLGARLVTALRGAAAGFRTLSVAILTNPIFLIAAVVIGLVAVFWHFREEIMAALGAAFGWMGDQFGRLIGWFRDLPERILDALAGLAGGVVDFLMRYHPVAILFRLVTGNWGELAAWFSALPGRVVDTLLGLSTVVLAFLTRWHPLAILYRLVRRFGPQALDAVGGIVTGVLDWFGRMRDRATGFVDDLVSTVVGFPRRVLDGIAGFGRSLWDAGANLVRSLIDGAGSILSRVGEFFLDKLPGWIVGPFKAALGIGSPSRVFAGYGEDLVAGLTAGLDGASDDALDEIERFANRAVAAGDMGALVIEPDVAVSPTARGSIRPGEADPGGAVAGVQVTQHIYTSDPVRAGRESVRELRDRVYLSAPLDDPIGLRGRGVRRG